MTCASIREKILEADLDELRGRLDSPLARHIRECAECGKIAGTIVETERAMGVSLDSMTADLRTNGSPPRRRRRYWMAAALPLAAAAGLVAVLLRGGSERSTITQLALPVMEAMSYVETPNNENFAVFNTDDPDIVVVWFFGGTNNEY